MDYLKILKSAEEKLSIANNEVIKDLKKIIFQGSTGGEITSIVGKFLNDLEYKNNSVFLVLKDEINQYLLSC